MSLKISQPAAILLVLLISISFVSAIEASIGNARMILRLEKGETIEKYVNVINNNNVSVNIEVNASGDLQDWIKIKDNAFTLSAGEEKKAYFEIKAEELGTTEGRIEIRFMPIDGKTGVGLSSTIIALVKEKNGWETDVEEDNSDGDVDTGVNAETGKVIADSGSESNTAVILVILSLGIVLVLLIVLLSVILKKKRSANKFKKEVKIR